MVPLSNTYNFGTNTDIDSFLKDAFERIGILGDEQTPLHLESALLSANLELSSWTGKGLNHWLVSRKMFPLIAHQTSYTLPYNTVDVLEVTGVLPQRLNSGGTAFSTAGGNPSNCFDPNQSGGCTQNAPNGSIGYDYGEGFEHAILYVGVTPLVNETYTLSIEYSFDNEEWIQAYLSPAQSFYATKTNWFVIDNFVSARSWRITETGGKTLAIQQIYFSQSQASGSGDRILGVMSRFQYMAQAQKSQTGPQSSYFLNKQNPLILTVWPVPADNTLTSMSHIVYTGYCYAQDIVQLFQGQQVPQKFYRALVTAVAADLAIKFAPERYELSKNIADISYREACTTDMETAPLQLIPNFDGW